MRRMIDKPYGTYSVHTAAATGICVSCPKCGGAGRVTADEARAYFRCTNCGSSRTKERISWQCGVENLCSQCGRYYRVRIDGGGERFSVLRAAFVKSRPSATAR